ncbi:uncharacterized protein N7484_005271 [Penicillium longicatenatum]|uniref:uncharacterized protein n=1 Tax=Penicillium longicatenatum TaxID=1561947 RepID=UPI002546BC18|nr:uncharacterized protein N7484_005271 [Penicillium longicatenatum]KAJ5651548.1 hypothetical protein N7484_005271 [Penicillium longicatenatum]
MPHWSSATLEPAFDYSREQRSAAPSPEIFLVEHLTEEAMEGQLGGRSRKDFNWYRMSESLKPPFPSSSPQSSHVAADCEQPSPAPVQRETQARPLKPQQVVGDPWRTWERFIEIVYVGPVWLAHRRSDKADLAHVQQLEQQPSVMKALLGSVGEGFHPSFLALKGCYLHENRTFLAWEPVELSPGQILASKCFSYLRVRDRCDRSTGRWQESVRGLQANYQYTQKKVVDQN